MIRAAFAHLVRAVAGALVRRAHKIEGGPIATIEGFGKEFCLALGLNPSGTGDITLHVPVEGAVTATVEKIFQGVNSDGLLELMTHASEYVTYAQQSTALSPRVIAHCIGSHMWLDGLDEEGWRIIADCLPTLLREDWMRTQRPSAYRRWTSFRKERKLEGKTQNATG